jgi:two-component system cell cycle response regulator
MSAPPVDSFSVAIEGFSAFERQSLTSFFRLAAQRSPAYRQVEEAGLSDFLIADADHAPSLAAVQRGQREGDTVFIGAQPPAGAVAWLARPIEPVHVLRELDLLVDARLALPSDRVPLDVDIDEAGPSSGPGAMDLLLPESRITRSASPPERRTFPRHGRTRGGAGRQVLVVEDSAVALQFLRQRLRKLGYRVETVTSGEAALELLERRSFPLAFVDINLGPPGSVDGLRVCQTIKQRAQVAGSACAVILTTGLDGASDRVRGSLAGADAYLVKPLLEAEFIAVLKQLDPAFQPAEA